VLNNALIRSSYLFLIVVASEMNASVTFTSLLALVSKKSASILCASSFKGELVS